MNGETTITRSDIEAGLAGLGIEHGMGLMVHSSMKSFGGHVIGGPGAVIDGLMARLSETGLLLMPSFNHGAPFEPGGAAYFDPLVTPTTNGLIADKFWRMDGVHRSLNPTHAFAAWGRGAEANVAHHHRALTMGIDSPLGRLYREGGFCLFVGTGYRSNTFHHVVETAAGARCLGGRREQRPVRLPDGRMVMGRTWAWRSERCPITQTVGYADRMTGFQRQTRVGTSTFTLYRLSDALRVMGAMLEQGVGDYPPCRRCPIAPRWSETAVASDWDEQRGRPVPDSEAWTY